MSYTSSRQPFQQVNKYSTPQSQNYQNGPSQYSYPSQSQAGPSNSQSQYPSYSYAPQQQQPNQMTQYQPIPGPSGPSSLAPTQTYNQPGQSVGYRSYSSPTSLQPQPVESVNKDEDPRYGPLGRAKAKVDRAMKADEEISPDLANMLDVPTNEPYAALPNQNQAFKPFRITKSVPMPDALHNELIFKDALAKMGLFEDIRRAWFTVNEKLFLWDYTDGRDFSRYDAADGNIMAVGLVKARRDVFVDEITHLLIICTATTVTLMGLSQDSKGSISLYSTNLTDSPTFIVQTILSTNSGRVFLLGADKNVHELHYGNKPGRIYGVSAETSMWIDNKTNHGVGSYLWIMKSSAPVEGILSIAVDPIQERLYTLHSTGMIEMYDLTGPSGWICKGSYSRLKADLNGRGLARSDVEAKVIMIAPVLRNESSRVCLMAVTANGTRCYFSYSLGLQLSHFRQPPQSQSGPLNLSSSSFYSCGTLLGVQHNTNVSPISSSLTIITPNYGRQSSQRENYDVYEHPYLSEWSVQEYITSQVWTIAEIPSTNPMFDGPTLKSRDVMITLNPIARQAVKESRQFLMLTTDGLHIGTMNRAVDMMSMDMEVDKDLAIRTSMLSFGRVQTAAMGILLGARSPESKSNDLTSAISNILLMSGHPIIKDTSTGRIIVYSARHDALALILSRFLRPIWNQRITVQSQAGQLLAVPQSILLSVQSRLEGLKKYIDNYPFPRPQSDGDVKIAWDQEEMSLHGLGLLVQQTVEAINFVCLLADHKLGEIVAKCEPALQSALLNMTYQDLLCSIQGRDVAKKLVTSLIEQQIGKEIGIDALSETLQQRCGSFCQPGDVVMYKAEECMTRAEQSRDPGEKNDYLSESLRLFNRAAGNIGVNRVKEVSKRYRNMGFTAGAIELPLQCASQLDPMDRANDYVRDGEHPSDPRKEYYVQRMECYACVIEGLGMFDTALNEATARGNPGPAIQKRDEAYSLAIASDDELFHFYLYDWHVARHLTEQLLEFDTPFIEKYLQLTSSSVEDRRDLLWKFYARREEYLPASKALFELAIRPSAMTLQARTYYLAQSLTSAKSAASVGTDDVEFVSSLQERIDVAQVQLEVARAIEVHHEMTREEKAEALGRLDRDLIGLDDLYQSFARPYRLYEPILLILKTADTRIDDVCEAVWRQLIQQAANDESEAGVGVDARVGEVVKSLIRRFYPSEAAPLDIVLPVIYSETSGLGGKAGWTSDALFEGGLQIRDLWEGVMSLHEEAEDDKEFFVEEAALLAELWTKRKNEIPAAEVERFASAYLLKVDGGNLDDRTRITRERFTAAKNAAGRY